MNIVPCLNEVELPFKNSLFTVEERNMGFKIIVLDLSKFTNFTLTNIMIFVC